MRSSGLSARAALHLAAGFLVLVAGQLLGGWIARATHLPVPGPVLGLVLLAASIELGLVPERLVSPAADLLLRHLSLLYVPAGAALLLYWQLVRREWLPIVAGGVASTLAVLVVTGVIMQRGGRMPVDPPGSDA
jgi:holin-like protein